MTAVAPFVEGRVTIAIRDTVHGRRRVGEGLRVAAGPDQQGQRSEHPRCLVLRSREDADRRIVRLERLLTDVVAVTATRNAQLRDR